MRTYAHAPYVVVMIVGNSKFILFSSHLISLPLSLSLPPSLPPSFPLSSEMKFRYAPANYKYRAIDIVLPWLVSPPLSLSPSLPLSLLFLIMVSLVPFAHKFDLSLSPSLSFVLSLSPFNLSLPLPFVLSPPTNAPKTSCVPVGWMW
jgi:hypothetical protein